MARSDPSRTSPDEPPLQLFAPIDDRPLLLALRALKLGDLLVAVPALKALAGPFGQARFCPTGGITPATAPDWLALDAVLCVGGSWVVPSGPLDPVRIEALAREAAALSRH